MSVDKFSNPWSCYSCPKVLRQRGTLYQITWFTNIFSHSVDAASGKILQLDGKKRHMCDTFPMCRPCEEALRLCLNQEERTAGQGIREEGGRGGLLGRCCGKHFLGVLTTVSVPVEVSACFCPVV